MSNLSAEKLNFILEQSKIGFMKAHQNLKNKDFYNSRIKFYDLADLSVAIKDAAPYLKIVFICREKDYLRNGLQQSYILKKLGNKVVNIVLPDDYFLSVDGVCKLFNVGEDVRAIFTVDITLSSTALYFATVRGIPAIISQSPHDALTSEVYIENKNKQDVFFVDADRFVILSNNLPNDDVQADLLSLRFSMFESVIFSMLNFDEELKSDLFSTCNFFEFDYSLDVKALYLNYLCGGKLLRSSTLCEVNELMQNKLLPKQKLLVCAQLVKLILRKKVGDIPDYNNLAQELSSVLGEGRKKITQILSNQLKKISLLKNVFEKANTEMNSFAFNLKKSPQFAGVDGLDKDIKTKLKLAGNLKYVNFATAIREK